MLLVTFTCWQPEVYTCVCLYLQDLRTNEARLQELNNIADRLTAMGKTEAADKIREQIAVSFTFFDLKKLLQFL